MYETPARWLYEIFVEATYVFGGGPEEPPEPVFRFVAPTIAKQAVRIDNLRLVVEQGQYRDNQGTKEGFSIHCVVRDAVADAALPRVLGAAELVLDFVALASAARCKIAFLQAWRVEPWPTSGQRVLHFWTPPQILARYRSTQGHATLRDPPKIHFPEGLGNLSTRLRAALRWYAKSCEAALDVDQFVFLLVTAEILAPLVHPHLEKQPYHAPCGHDINECPVCAKSIARPVLGERIRRLLSEGGVDEDTAKQLWKSRQLVHGSNDLTEPALSPMPDQVNALRGAVFRWLTRLLGEDGAPVSPVIRH